MENMELDLDDGSSPSDQNQANPQEARNLSIQFLEHIFYCRDASCRLPRCQRIKRAVRHHKICKRKGNGGCRICKQVIALCWYHAILCQETKCSVRFCLDLKQRMKQLQLQRRSQQAQLLRRRMAAMNTRTTFPFVVIGLPVDSSAGDPGGVLAGGPVGQAGAGSMVSLQAPHQPAGSKPGTQTPPANVLQVVKQVQEEATGQQAPQVDPIGPSNTHLSPIIDQCRYVPNATLQDSGLQQTAPEVIQQQQAQKKEVLQQLLQTLKSPRTPEQQQQHYLHIVKSNLQLKAAFIKQCQVYQQQHGQAGAGHQQQLQHMMSPQQQQQQQGRMHLQAGLVRYPSVGVVGFEPTQYIQQPGTVVAQQQPGLKPTPPPVPSLEGAGAGTIMTDLPPGTGSADEISVEELQQLMEAIRLPPPSQSQTDS